LAESPLPERVRLALGEVDPSKRRRLLAGVGDATVDAETLRVVMQALKSDVDLGARTAAMEVLVAIGPQALPSLSSLLDDDSVGIRRLVVDVLGSMATPAVMPLLQRATTDVSTTVRAAALDGVARVGGDDAVKILRRKLDADVPGPVALAALLGLDQLGANAEVGTLTRWLDDALTGGAALRLLGRAGALDVVSASLTSPSRLRARAAILGLAEGLERPGHMPLVLSEGGRERAASFAAEGDVAAAGAAVVVLAHIGDLRGVHAALGRADVTSLLPALHRAVDLAERAGANVGAAMVGADTTGKSALVEVIPELDDAMKRRRHQRVSARSPAKVVTLSDETFRNVALFCARSAGLALAIDAKSRVEARLLPRLEARGAGSFEGYLALMERDAAECAAAVDVVTVHETYFFREPTSLDGFRDELLPVLSKTKEKLQVWSAGCSTGEEAFTLAGIMFEGMLAGTNGDFQILGTDVSRPSVDFANRAMFAERSFRRAMTPQESALFERSDGPGLRPRAELRARVRCEVMNLVDDAAATQLPLFDVIFCRNVLIYLTPEARQRVLKTFHQRLKPGGALVLGHSESLLHVENPFALWPLRRGLAYRRTPA